MADNISCPTMIGIAEASKRTNISYDYLRKLCLQNKIVHIRAGVRYLINFEKLVEYLNQGDQEVS